MRKRHRKHPFLMVDSKYNTEHKEKIKPEIKGILYEPVKISRHHLYPKDRTGGQGRYSNITLKIWCYKHFYGWNSLFQFFYKDNGKTIHSELTIDEIITLMILKHSFIVDKIGTKPWKVLFKEKNLEQATDLLCRMLSIKFNRHHEYIIHEKINVAIPKKIAA